LTNDFGKLVLLRLPYSCRQEQPLCLLQPDLTGELPNPASRETADRELLPDRGAYRQKSSLPAGRERTGSRSRKEQGKT